MSKRAEEVKKAADEAVADKKLLKQHVENLESTSRRERQNSAAVLAEVARIDVDLVVPYGNELVEALERPEAQTRWESLDALTEVCAKDSRVCDKALTGAENALYDEDSGPLRLAAMRFLCTLGATTENRSEKVWPLVDEGIQCYHGDVEFNEMLLALIDFSAGKLAPSVKKELATRMKFDAENGKGTLGKRATQIQKNLSKKK